MTDSIKQWLIYVDLALFSAAAWYCIAEVFLSYVWKAIWH